MHILIACLIVYVILFQGIPFVWSLIAEFLSWIGTFLRVCLRIASWGILACYELVSIVVCTIVSPVFTRWTERRARARRQRTKITFEELMKR